MCEFTMKVSLGDDGRINIDTINEGFGALEIIGFLEAKKGDIINQLNDASKYSRKVRDKNGNEIEITDV